MNTLSITQAALIKNSSFMEDLMAGTKAQNQVLTEAHGRILGAEIMRGLGLYGGGAAGAVLGGGVALATTDKKKNRLRNLFAGALGGGVAGAGIGLGGGTLYRNSELKEVGRGLQEAFPGMKIEGLPT